MSAFQVACRSIGRTVLILSINTQRILGVSANRQRDAQRRTRQMKVARRPATRDGRQFVRHSWRPSMAMSNTPADKTSSDSIAWCQPAAAPYNPSVLVYGDRMYVLYDKGFFACYDALTGDLVYDRQRIPNGKAFTASPWAYRGQVFCLNEYGETFVFAAGDEFKLTHTNALAEDDMCMATPAIAGEIA